MNNSEFTDIFNQNIPNRKDRPPLNSRANALDIQTPKAWNAIAKYNNPPTLFIYGDCLVRIERDSCGNLRPIPMDKHMLSHELIRRSNYYTPSGKDEAQKPTHPPANLIQDMIATPRHKIPLPALSQIIQFPQFACDGTLHITPGYNKSSKVLYVQSPGLHFPTIESNPSQADVEASKSLLLDELLGGFPFAGESEVANLFALLFHSFVRELFTGPAPLYLVEKSTPGTGATLLVQSINYILTGKPLASMTDAGSDEAEWRKAITSEILKGSSIILIDNVRTGLNSGILSSLITSESWGDRLLATNKTVSLPVRSAVVATGNNPRLSTEMARRIVRIRLDAELEQPWIGREFKHPNLLEWVTENRGNIIAAILTLVQSWIAAGKPKSSGPVLGMFESWSLVMGGILEVVGIPGFLKNLNNLYESSDSEGKSLVPFIAEWWSYCKDKPRTAGELWRDIIAGTDSGDNPDFTIDLGSGNHHSQRIKLGQLLSQIRDRVYKIDNTLNVRVIYAGESHRTQKWKLVALGGECVSVGESPATRQDIDQKNYSEVVN